MLINIANDFTTGTDMGPSNSTVF